jgi:hypothetical protein
MALVFGGRMMMMMMKMCSNAYSNTQSALSPPPKHANAHALVIVVQLVIDIFYAGVVRVGRRRRTQDATTRLASILRYINKPQLVSKLIFFQTFLNFFHEISK